MPGLFLYANLRRKFLDAGGGPALALSAGVSRSHAVSLLLTIMLAACTEETTLCVPLTAVQEEVLLTSEADDPPLEAAVSEDARTAQVHLTWSMSCRRALVPRERRESSTTRTAIPGAGAGAGFGAIATGAVGGGLLAHLDAFSDVKTCETDSDGNEQCSSPRDDAAVSGAVLVTAAVALAAVSVATLATKPTTTYGRVELGPPGRPHVVESGVACGTGVPSGIGLGLYRADERVAASTTDANGDATLRIPDWLSGPLDIVVDSTGGAASIQTGTVVAKLQISP